MAFILFTLIGTSSMHKDFEGLRNKLIEKTSFPTVYMFKFIIPANNEKMAKLEAIFSSEAQISHRESSNKKYISITAKEVVLNVDEIISVYIEASKIEGLMAL